MNKIVVLLAFIAIGCASVTPPPPPAITNLECKQLRYVLTDIMTQEVDPFLQSAHAELSNNMSNREFWLFAIAIIKTNPLSNGYTKKDRELAVAELTSCREGKG